MKAAAAGAWTPAQTQEILDRTETIRLASDISHLSAGERVAVQKLIEVGRIFQRIYEDQRHHQALAAKARLREGSAEATLYRLFQGPIANTLDNQRVPFLGVQPIAPGKTVYPWGIEAAELDAREREERARRRAERER